MPYTLFTEEDMKTLIRLKEEGLTLSAIAREMGRAKSTISIYADKAGLTFDRSRTAAATKAVVVDNAAMRAELERKALEQQYKIYDVLNAPAYESKLVTVKGEEVTITTDTPPAKDYKELVQAIGTLANTSLKYAEKNNGENVEGAKSLLGMFLGTIEKRSEEIDNGISSDESGTDPVDS